ncbi:hypothetical protein F7734_33150 [Scytonema sp. UIC 10036]|uniref:hypothetical protein n=1 Tax=Scytonema sp. UIC 10036 TaxID=2304196 RepID=UPI0012DAB8ED|nr:hypothetical protein [Scytonema sp. UIC 10036]MUG96930.1 hypothetical protein [Scytonema sp. UIC 10036]
MTNQRPTGVTILAVLQFLGGILSLLFGVSGLFFGGLIVAAGGSQPAGEAATMGPILLGASIGALISGTIGLIAGFGLFTLKGWGWMLASVFSILNILNNLVSLFQGANVAGAIVGIVISGLILYYLNQSNVKRAFGKA